MNKNERTVNYRLRDALYIAMMVLPLMIAMVIKILINQPSDGVNIAGAIVLCIIPIPFTPTMPLVISEAQVNSWLVIITILGACLYLTNGLGKRPQSRRQLACEWIVEKLDGLVSGNMDPLFASYAPFVGSIMALSLCSSLMSLLGVFPPTSDLNVVAGWAILVFILITKNKLKAGLGSYLKGFLDPIPVMLPMNILSEVATPISMSFRHFGNVLSGSAISALVAWALSSASAALLGWLPGVLAEIPFLRIGLPALLSAYFDVVSGCLQAFIFAMLTMLYVSNAYPGEEIAKLLAKRQEKKNKRLKAA